MRMMVVDERTLEVYEKDIDPKKRSEQLKDMMPEMRCMGVSTFAINGREYSFAHDDEFLYHRRNITGICEDSEGLFLGSFIISAFKEYEDDDDDDDEDWGLRDLTDEEVEDILKAWRPVAPGLALRYARETHKSLLYTMGSNMLHYMADPEGVPYLAGDVPEGA